MPPITEPSSPPLSPASGSAPALEHSASKPEIPERPKSRPRRRSRSADPALRSSVYSNYPLTPPAATYELAREAESPRREVEARDGYPLPRPLPSLPRLQPDTAAQAEEQNMDSFLRRNRSVSSKPKPTAPLQRYHSETPVPSTMSGLIQQQQQQQHQLPEGVLPYPTHSVGEHPVAHMPPSPPLTRHSTTTTVRSGKHAPPQATSQKLAPPENRLSGATQVAEPVVTFSASPTPIPRPPTASSKSTVSLKDVQKVGKQLGATPVDYLLLNGSLKTPVSAYFHPTHDPTDLTCPPSMASDGEDNHTNPVAGIFGNLNFLLDSYIAILSNGGSIAVGTGYHSVARRLLERVEGIFARDLGVEGVCWADVLEYLRGSRQRPFLCVLPVRGLLSTASALNGPDNDDDSETRRDLAESVVAGIAHTPPKGKVDAWLEEVSRSLSSDADPTPRPTSPATTAAAEVEEDKLIVSIIETTLSSNGQSDQIPIFRSYLGSSALITNTKKALERLYPTHPPQSITPPVVALYLLLHPDLHPVLRALASVSENEVELIMSGRFDAFLDGRDNVVGTDEDQELAAIAGLDRRLWSVLEGLEDEIEELHTRALVVRRALKGRKEGILRRRPERSSSTATGRPDSAMGQTGKADADDEREKDAGRPAEDTEWEHEWESLRVPIVPDDSASNITTNRRRRMQRSYELAREGSEREKERHKRKSAEKEKEKEKERKRKPEVDDEEKKERKHRRNSDDQDKEKRKEKKEHRLSRMEGHDESDAGTAVSRRTHHSHRRDKDSKHERREKREREGKEKEKDRDEHAPKKEKDEKKEKERSETKDKDERKEKTKEEKEKEKDEKSGECDSTLTVEHCDERDRDAREWKSSRRHLHTSASSPQRASSKPASPSQPSPSQPSAPHPEDSESAKLDVDADKKNEENKKHEKDDKADKEKGDKEKGDKEKGDKEKGDKEKGDKEKGDKEKGDKGEKSEKDKDKKMSRRLWKWASGKDKDKSKEKGAAAAAGADTEGEADIEDEAANLPLPASPVKEESSSGGLFPGLSRMGSVAKRPATAMAAGEKAEKEREREREKEKERRASSDRARDGHE